MEDKSFELLTRMYGEFSEFRNEFKGLKNDVIRIEDKLDNNSKAVFDGYKQTYEEVVDVKKTMNEISSKVDRLFDKVDKQEVEIKVIKGGKA